MSSYVPTTSLFCCCFLNLFFSRNRRVIDWANLMPVFFTRTVVAVQESVPTFQLILAVTLGVTSATTSFQPSGHVHAPAPHPSPSTQTHLHHKHHQPSPAIAVGYTPAPKYLRGAHAVSPNSVYGVTPAPYAPYAFSPAHHYGGPSPTPNYGHAAPKPVHSSHESAHAIPSCAQNASVHHSLSTWCLEDYEYPSVDIQHAIEYHYAAVASLYKDVIANTDNSVDRLKYPQDETYLCPSDTGYVTPLRAVNTEGKWRIVVNGVRAHYETLSQTARIEACRTAGQPCPLVPECYATKCLQKFVYHRFLVYNPYDYYFPFAIEGFKLPSSCACVNGAYKYQKHH